MAAVNKYNPSAFAKVTMSSATMAGTKDIVIPRYTIVLAFYKYLKKKQKKTKKNKKIFFKFKNKIFFCFISATKKDFDVDSNVYRRI
jgi:hypothetical protein